MNNLLPFASSEFGWIDQPKTDTFDDDVNVLHRGDTTEIRLCACYRCYGYKYMKLRIIKRNQLQRDLTAIEHQELYRQMVEETTRQRALAGRV